MDNTPKQLTSVFASNLSKKNFCEAVDARGYSSALGALWPEPTGASSSYFPNLKGVKRKWSTVDRPMKVQDGSSLALGWGRSSSSCITISSGKEIEESSSINLGLSINLPSENHGAPNPKYISEKPKIDLELSLSTLPAESDTTTFSQVKSDTVQLVDEGSTSLRWKLRSLLPPLHNVEATTPFNPTPVVLNLSPSATLTPTTSVPFSSPILQQRRRNAGVKTCQFNGCTRRARGASGFCIAHGGGRRCQREGCQKGAEGKTVFCKAHGGGRRCQSHGCTKSAEGRTDFCIGHGGGRRCNHEGCTHAARGKSGLCIRHGGGKRCKMEFCTKSAEGVMGLCISHGGGHRCQYPACAKGAQGSTMFCKAHGGGKRCTFLGCTKGADGSTPFCKGHGGGKRCAFEGGCTKSVHGGTLFCVSHGGGKRCAVPDCTKSARGKTDFCVRHGGGKRCKYEGCGKSAQGSTDFCKAHGGGKRCSWGQSEFGGEAAAAPPCVKFARGKSGLCAAHSAQVQEKVIGSGVALESGPSFSEKMKGIFASGNHHHVDGIKAAASGGTSMLSIGNDCLGQISLPEGRVHGGSLMAMLRAGTRFGPSNNDNKAKCEP